MAYIKTLTVNGSSYTVRDPEAARIDDTTVGADAWSSKNTVYRLCPGFTESGGAVACEPVEGYPLGVVSGIAPAQEGSEDPSPDNIRPITGYTSVSLYQTGKNLLNVTAVTATTKGVTFAVADDGTVTVNGTATGNAYFEVGKAQLIKGQSYVVSGCPIGGNAQNTYSLYASHEGKYYIDIGNGVSFDAVASKITTLRIQIKSGATVTGLRFRPMVRLASVADDTYEKYAEGSKVLSVNLGQTVYGGSFDWKTGLLTVDKALYTVTGEEAIVQDDSASDHMFILYHELDNVGLYKPCICSHFLGTESEASYAIAEEAVSACNPVFVFNSSTLANAEGGAVQYFKDAYAAGTPVQVVYTLTQPYTVQLTAQEMLALEGVNTLSSPVGAVTVSGRADPTVVIEKLTNAILALGGNV